jgi:hypothetical protein
MPEILGREFEKRIEVVAAQLARISEADSGKLVREGGWSKKQVLGHLLDSSANNHLRFVRATLEGSYEGPGYAQKECVDLHGYGDWSWKDLVEQWKVRNNLLTRVVHRIPESKLSATCRIESGDPVTLRFLIVDYLGHMENHVHQIAEIA